MDILNANQVAERLGVTQQTVSRISRDGKLPFTLVGSRRLYQSSDIDAYMSRNNLSEAPKDHVRHTTEIPSITAVSFFSGALGLDLGIEQAGITPLLFCENDARCRMTIDSNRPSTGLLGDISTVNADKLYECARIPRTRGIDVMFGGPPCQAFSTAGARRAFADARGNVFLKFLDLADDVRPRYLVIENVRGLLSTAFPLDRKGEPVRGGAMHTVLKRLNTMGYTTSFNLYNAANYGAAQIRERVVIIAKLGSDRVPWLIPTHSDDTSWGLPAWKTLGEVLKCVDEPLHYIQFPKKRLEYFRMLSEGEYWRDLPKEIQPQAMGKAYGLSGGKTGFYRRLRRDRPCATLVTSPTMPATDLCHPTEDRPLAVEEYKAIQGFPSNWRIRGSISDIYRQIGNAVPLSLGEAVGRAIINDMNGTTDFEAVEHFCNFPYSRYKHTNEKTWCLAY